MPFLKNILPAAVIIIFWAGGLLAQSTSQDQTSQRFKGWSVATLFSHGKVIKHTPNFKPEIKGPSNALELNFSKQTDGKKDWQQIFHYPSPGIAIGYTNYGNQAVLGSGIWLMPNMDIPLLQGKQLSLNFRVGCGIAFLSKHYDYVTNPENNVIASTVNNITSLSMAGKWQIASQVTLMAGGSLTHFSTGAVRTPNLGINISAWSVGVGFQPVPRDRSTFIKKTLPAAAKKILLTVNTGIGFQEQLPAKGPMYHVYVFQFSVGKMITRWNKLSVGTMGTYKEAANSFIKHQEIYPDHYFANSCAVAGFIQDNILLGFTGISISAGYNFYKPSPLEYGFYQKLGVPVYFPALGNKKNSQFSVGVYVTAGEFTADYVSVDAGFQF
ncbi:MAG: acyloxyacyl hydrolase [Chitinophagales bacterium]